MGLLVAAHVVAACSDGDSRSLVAHDRWSTADARDPWPEHAPATTECSSLAWGDELSDGASVLEVDTGACDYLVVGQGILEAVAEGDAVTARIAHGELEAGEASEAHVGVVIGDWAVLDELVSIPAEGGTLGISEPAPRDFDVGASAVLHLHNHGANSWRLEMLGVEEGGE